jgi:PIN domain nuclease of toxin-antitoxin system
VRLLLDTHVFLWAVSGSRKLNARTRKTLESASAVFVSAASIWEIAIKARLGKLQADPAALLEAIDASGFIELSVTARHAAKVAELPDLHPDPFDRLLVAQAICEPLLLVTADTPLAGYGDAVRVL